MIGVEGWAEIRRLHFVKDLSICEIARRTGQGRNAVRRALRTDEPPRFGHVDCLVNSAGVMQSSPFRAGLVEEWRTMVETNLLGVLHGTHAFVEDLLRRV